MLKTLDLFSGIGGFSLGLERTGGFKTTAFCEIDHFNQKVIKKHWPDIPVHRDIKTLKGEELGEINVIAGGYPCQPFSTAGLRGGEKDDRHLWPEMLRLIKEIRPDWVIGENVVGHINLGLDTVLSDLESEGYTCTAFDIPACSVGAWHRRPRVWIIAHRNSKRGCGWDAEREHAKDAWEPPIHSWIDPRGVGYWDSEPSVGRVVHGLPGRVDRLRSIGNSIVPQIAEVIGHAILNAAS